MITALPRWMWTCHGPGAEVIIPSSQSHLGVGPPLGHQPSSLLSSYIPETSHQKGEGHGNSLSSWDKGCQVNLFKRNPTFQAAQVSHRNWSISTLAGEREKNLEWYQLWLLSDGLCIQYMPQFTQMPTDIKRPTHF